MSVHELSINLVVLVVLSFFDVKYKIAPNYITIPYVFLGVFGVFFGFSNRDWFLNLFELFIVLIAIFVYSRVRKENLFQMFGGGDIKTLLGFSFFCSFETFNFSIILGALLGITWGVLTRKKGVEFIPFILVGYIVRIIFFYLFGDSLDIFQYMI